MKKTIVTILILISLIAVGCSIGEEEHKTDRVKIGIGVIIPLSGNGGIYGNWARNGLEIAKDEINQDQDIQLELIYEDGQFKPNITVNSFWNLVNNYDIHYLLTWGSSPAVAVAPLANSHKIIQIDASATTSAYRSKGDYTFRTAPQAEQFGIEAAKWLVDQKEQQAVMLYINNDQGQSILKAFRTEYKKLGGNLLASEKFEQDGKDFKTILTKVIADRDCYIFLIGHLKESGLVVRQMDELGYDNSILSHMYSIEGDTFLSVAGGFTNQIIYFAPDYRADKNIQIKKYDNEYKRRYGENSNYFSAFAYDALQVLSLAMSKCEDLVDTDCVKDELFEVEGYQGLTGEITFDGYGDRVVDLTLKTIKDGEFVFYDSQDYE